MAESKFESSGTYSPKAEKNLKSYEEVLAHLPATLTELRAALPEHKDFVGYLIRRKALVPSTEQAPTRKRK